MKSFRIVSILLINLISVVSCQFFEQEDYKEVLVAKPIVMTKAEFKDSAKSIAPQPMNDSGKIYAYGDFIFINEPYQGIHVIDNSDPTNPYKVRFIKIPGSIDMSIKNNYLFADSLSDIVVLDISDINAIRPVARLEQVLNDNTPWPFEADIVESGNVDYTSEVIVGWELATELRKVEEVSYQLEQETLMLSAAADNGTGEGGSMARFKIVDNYLYVVDSHNINVFDILDLEAPKKSSTIFAGFDIETIFNRGDELFLGSKSGMYIYDITHPETPSFISEFQHGTACDPVVVDDQYAYVTLRGGNECGATESGLFIIDITDMKNPVQVAQYELDGPYGLGIKDHMLFVCDGSSGLKVYDKSDVLDLKSMGHYKDILTYDVIPLESHLLMIGDKILHQYSYNDQGVSLMSSFKLTD